MPQNPNKYSVKKLLALLEGSPTYASLPAARKNIINAHLKAKNTPVLKFVYYALLEEQQVNKQAKEELAEKVLKIGHQKASALAKNIYQFSS